MTDAGTKFEELIDIVQNAREKLFISTYSIIGLDNLKAVSYTHLTLPTKRIV